MNAAPRLVRGYDCRAGEMRWQTIAEWDREIWAWLERDLEADLIICPNCVVLTDELGDVLEVQCTREEYLNGALEAAVHEH